MKNPGNLTFLHALLLSVFSDAYYFKSPKSCHAVIQGEL